MPGIVGMGTTFNLPNFVGEIYGVSREDTPLLSAIGGLTGGKEATAKSWEWQFYDLREPEDRTRVEGAKAPTAEQRTRFNASNVVEIHQEAIEVSYTRLATRGAIDAAVGVLGSNPITDEEAWQVEQAQKQIARDINWAFINQTYQSPADNTQPRKTRGLLAAIVTNVVDGGAAALTKLMVLDMLQDAWDAGGLRETETRTLLTNSTLKRSLTKLFITDANYREETRNVGGVNLQVIETDFGRLNIMMDPAMPQNVLAAASLEDLQPVHLLIPGKGFLFVEPLAKDGASERSQIYGEVGLEYGNEMKHAKIVNVAPAAGA